MNAFHQLYTEVIRFQLQKEFNYKNPHNIPKIIKIVISSGLGLFGQNTGYLESYIENYIALTGQYPQVTKAKKSNSGFKLREGMPIGIFVTLRRKKMYCFFEKLIKLALPRVRDFQGLSKESFDAFGNYTFGISDQYIFPEISFENSLAKKGFNITIVTTSKNKKESLFLLQGFNFPFQK